MEVIQKVNRIFHKNGTEITKKLLTFSCKSLIMKIIECVFSKEHKLRFRHMGMDSGENVTVSADGEDEAAAIEGIEKFLSNKDN